MPAQAVSHDGVAAVVAELADLLEWPSSAAAAGNIAHWMEALSGSTQHLGGSTEPEDSDNARGLPTWKSTHEGRADQPIQHGSRSPDRRERSRHWADTCALPLTSAGHKL